MGSAFIKRSTKIFHGIENSAILVSLFFIILFPAMDMLGLALGKIGSVDAPEYLRHLMIWFTMLGAMISSRERKHISLAVIEDMLPKKWHKWTGLLAATVTATVLMALGYASVDHFLLVSAGEKIGKLPALFFTISFPIGFFVMAFRASLQKKTVLTAITMIIAVLFPVMVMGVPTLFLEKFFPDFMPSVELFSKLYIPLFILLIGATALGAPVFIALAGAAGLLFFNSEQMLGYLPNEAYEVLTDEIFPTIPLFTMAGFVLSESKSGERLVKAFRELIGWIPGGIGVMAVVVCAFFTTFTGASGVTILALGGLLHYIMVKDGFTERFSEGYLTASGSIGLLFAPSLPIILYGVQAQINIKHLFAGGIFPGLLMVASLSLYAVYKGVKKRKLDGGEKLDKEEVVKGIKTSFLETFAPVLLGVFLTWLVLSRGIDVPFNFDLILVYAYAFFLSKKYQSAALEALLPLIILRLFFSGDATILQTGVIAVIYMVITNLWIHRDFTLKELPRIFVKGAPVAGSVLIILAAAKGLSYFIVDAEIPAHLTAWVSEVLDPANPSSKIIFLLILNVALLITGFFMDIFSAIFVIVPLILPISRTFGIDPVHLGIIFLANLELGYLTPPVGLNLFLSALRFEKPLVEIYKSVIPFLIIRLITVLLITYIPILTLGGLKLFGF